MADGMFRFKDENGALREIDTKSGTMLVHDLAGGITEERVVEAHDEFVQLGRGRDGRPIKMRADEIKQMCAQYAHRMTTGAQATRRGERSHLMDIGIGDVMQASPLPNVAMGFSNAGGIADLVSPVIPTTKPSAKYYVWDKDDAFQVVDNLETGPDGNVAEVSPRLSNTLFNTTEFAIGSFVPTEVEAAADAPLRPYYNATRRCLQVIDLAREIRVQAVVGTAASYAAGQKVDLSGDATKKWGPSTGSGAGGANSDPVANLQAVIEGALMEPTGIGLSRKAYNAFVRNAQVQKYVASKTSTKPIPGSTEWSSLLELPPFYVAKMKRKNKTTGTYDYIWGNDIVLFHTPPGVPTDGMDISSAYSYRWSGGATPDGNMQGGFLVRGFFDQKRGPKGGMMVIVVHQDADLLVSSLVGGMVVGALQ